MWQYACHTQSPLTCSLCTVCIRTYVRMYVCTCIPYSVCTYIREYYIIYICTYICIVHIDLHTLYILYIILYCILCMYVRTYICTVHIDLHALYILYVVLYCILCMYVCMYICMYVCTVSYSWMSSELKTCKLFFCACCVQYWIISALVYVRICCPRFHIRF